jgi:hypothetical protein
VNKKGDIGLDNTLSIIMAVMSLLIILGIGWAVISGSYKVSKLERDNAETLADLIKGKIDALDVGDEGKFLLRNPRSRSPEDSPWFLTGWGENSRDRPDSCFGGCICVCDGDCARGICEEIDVDEIVIEGNVEKLVGGGGGGAGGGASAITFRPNIGGVEYIALTKPITEIEVEKTNEKITIRVAGARDETQNE